MTEKFPQKITNKSTKTEKKEGKKHKNEHQNIRAKTITVSTPSLTCARFKKECAIFACNLI
jgi:hypothetical protein